MVVCYTAWMMETIPRDRAAKYDKATCVSNLRCVERAMLMYVEDHGDRLPPAAAWPEGLRRYGADGTALVCPADARERKNVSPRGRRLETSYTQDWRLAGQPFAALGGVADQKVAHFDGLALLGGPEALDPRHNGGVCLGYLDGHVEWRRPADIPPEAWQVP
jgi:prepilin-type processing-associated H-X9-DG protein